MRSWSKRALAGISLVVGAVMVPATASAHVTIDTYGDVAQGGFSKLGVSVPNERDDAGTIAVEIQLPAEHPMPFVSVQPKPGWTVATTTRTLAEPIEPFGTTYDTVVDTIAWTADEGVRIGPGEFDVFWISVGPLPTDVDTLELPALQTYEGGEVVRWIEPTPLDGEEPQHPAPTVSLVTAGDDAHGHTDEGSAVAGSSDEAVAGDDDNDDDGDGSTLAIVALVVGALGLVVGAAALATGRRGRPAHGA
jgi:uncharacterized protein YcnI